MLTQREVLNMQEQINNVFSTHWERIDKLEEEVQQLKEALAATQRPKASRGRPRKEPEGALEAA